MWLEPEVGEDSGLRQAFFCGGSGEAAGLGAWGLILGVKGRKASERVLAA